MMGRSENLRTAFSCRRRPPENPPQNEEEVSKQLGDRWEFLGNYPLLPPDQANPKEFGLLWAAATLKALGKIEKWTDNQPAFDDDGNSLPTHKAFYIKKTDPLNPPPKWGF